MIRWAVFFVIAAVSGCPPTPVASSSSRPRVRSDALATGQLPATLSQSGLFVDLRDLRPVAGMVPYDLNVAFWSDGAQKRRWMLLPPGGKVHFSKESEWTFPLGTVFVKHFEMPGDSCHLPRRLETRVLVYLGKAQVVGGCYRWRTDGSDADLVNEPRQDQVIFASAPQKKQTWYFPGRADCIVCHTPASGGVLGVNTRQLNRALGSGANQLVEWQRAGFFEKDTSPIDPKRVPGLARADNESRSIEDRARSYLDANCAQCHRPGGVAGNFDARYRTPLARQNLIDGPVLIDLGIDGARLIAPNDPWRSIILNRVETLEQTRMPPLAHETLDRNGAKVLRKWISSMPGREVLPPPVISPKGADFKQPVRVTIRDARPGAVIHFTTDGSVPTKSSAVYSGAIEIKEPTTLRARAYAEGFTRSVVVQETFVIGD